MGKNSKGFSLLESLLGLGLLTFVALIAASLANWQNKENGRHVQDSAMSALRDALLANIANQESWDQTKQHNANMACSLNYPSTCASPMSAQEIALYGSDGKLFLGANTTLANSGFTSNGTPCSAYTVTGNSRCPIHVHVLWQVSCQGTISCKYPEELVSIIFDYSPDKKDNKPLNVARYNVKSFSRLNFGENNSPVITCARKGTYVFIGFGQSVANGDGVRTSADSDGCVNIIAFQGQTGDQGPMGPQGPQGPMGPSGGSGGTISGGGGGGLAMTPEQQACAGYPAICALYKQYLGRLPDVAGAEYWNSALLSGYPLSSIAAEFASRAAGNIVVYTTASGQNFSSSDLWAQIAAKYGLSTSSGACSGASTCTGANAQATQEWINYINNFCATPGNSCTRTTTYNPG